jgi:hypothetical protein
MKTHLSAEEWLRTKLSADKMEALLKHCAPKKYGPEFIFLKWTEDLAGICGITEEEALKLRAEYRHYEKTTPYPAVIGQVVPVFQNSGTRYGTVVKVTKTRVRVEWPKVTQDRWATAGRWFRNWNGMIGDPDRNILRPGHGWWRVTPEKRKELLGQ